MLRFNLVDLYVYSKQFCIITFFCTPYNLTENGM